jgi:FO synthase
VDLAAEATELGATELCIQGAVDPQLPGSAYLDIVATLHSAQPALHLHAFRPIEISDGAARLGLSVADFLQALREAGVSTVPGTGARILDDSIRAVLSGYTDPPASEWVSNITAAHRAGLRSTASMVFGHIETAAQQVAHLRSLAAIQDSTGGFTEFIPMPFVKADAPASVAAAVTAAGTRGNPEREARAVTAVARLMLHGRINNIQVAWTKLGMVTSRAALAGGANDIGGLLLDGTIWPEAGPEAHRTLSRADVEQIAAALGRTVRQRTTDYGVAAALESVG